MEFLKRNKIVKIRIIFSFTKIKIIFNFIYKKGQNKPASSAVLWKIKSEISNKDSLTIEKVSGKKYQAINNITLYTDCETSKGFFREQRSYSKDLIISENIKGFSNILN